MSESTLQESHVKEYQAELLEKVSDVVKARQAPQLITMGLDRSITALAEACGISLNFKHSL